MLKKAQVPTSCPGFLITRLFGTGLQPPFSSSMQMKPLAWNCISVPAMSCLYRCDYIFHQTIREWKGETTSLPFFTSITVFCLFADMQIAQIAQCSVITWSCRWPNGFAKIRRCTKLVVTSDGIKCWGHPDSGEASSTGRSEALNLCPNFLKVMHRIITHGIHLAGGDTLIPLDAQGQKSCKGTWALWWKLIFWYCLETWIEHAVATQHMLHWLLGSF